MSELDITCFCCDSTSVVESHWRIWGGSGVVAAFVACGSHVEESKRIDRNASAFDSFTTLYLPIVQPVMGSDAALCIEVAMHAVCRLLRGDIAELVAAQAAYDAEREAA